MDILAVFLRLLMYAVLADAISSWFIRDPEQFPRNIIRPIVEPLYKPVHALIPPGKSGFDFSPLILIIVLQLLARLALQGGV